MKVYLVKQTQPLCNYEDETIYVCSTKEKAIDYCRKLNKAYGKNVLFNEDCDFIGFCEGIDYDSVHYYDWKSMEVDEQLA